MTPAYQCDNCGACCRRLMIEIEHVDMSTYTEMQVFRIPNGIVHCGPPSCVLIDGPNRWLTEWHPYHGPSMVDADGDIPTEQPDEDSRFWLVAQWWKNQGAVVVDGIGQWQEPPKIVTWWVVRGRHWTHSKVPGPGPYLRSTAEYDHAWKGPSND